ncbi:MAG: hypothetical protein ICV66_03635 [Chitinophagaceae bacterium]|nr:hypothetical protein [Chitinophagaceae bacterium]
MNQITTGGSIIPESIDTYVLYDDVGTIHHIHKVITLKGAERLSEYDLEARTASLAQTRKKLPPNLKWLQVRNDALEPNNKYAVDLKTLSLIKKESRQKKDENLYKE